MPAFSIQKIVTIFLVAQENWRDLQHIRQMLCQPSPRRPSMPSPRRRSLTGLRRSRHSREENANKKVAQHGSRTDVEKRDERPFHATDC